MVFSVGLAEKEKAPRRKRIRLRHRARWIYDDLLVLFSWQYPETSIQSGHQALIFFAGEVALLVSGFEHATVLHYYAEASTEAHTLQQAHHGAGKHLRLAHLAAKFGEGTLVVLFVQWFTAGRDRGLTANLLHI